MGMFKTAAVAAALVAKGKDPQAGQRKGLAGLFAKTRAAAEGAQEAPADTSQGNWQGKYSSSKDFGRRRTRRGMRRSR